MMKILKYIAYSFFRIRFLRRLLLLFAGNTIYGDFKSESLVAKCRIRIDKTNSVRIAKNCRGKNISINIEGNNNVVLIDECVTFGFPVCFEIYGDNNMIFINSHACFVSEKTKNRKAIFRVNGSGCKIELGPFCNIHGTFFSTYDNESTLLIGENALIGDDTRFISMEGCSLKIGKRFFCSYSVEIRNSDAHSIFGENGERLNRAKNIFIGDDVWIAQGALVLKGANIPNGCVVGARSLVNKPFSNENSILIGSPAIEKKCNILWRKDRINELTSHSD